MTVKQKLNLNRVFRANTVGFINQIKPNPDIRDELDKCRRAIRSHLTPIISDYIAENFKMPSIRPKFRVQGSWAYGTCNLPAKLCQELDLDYGIYIPASVLDSTNSSEAARLYFEAVEKSLSELASVKGWGIDKTKDTCVRLKVKHNAHIDVPLYAVPNKMFDGFEENHELVEAKAKYDSIHKRTVQLAFDGEEKLIDLENISTIHMAKRDGSWKSSDCEQIRFWFNNCLREQLDNGRQLRYVTRYLKAWRDHVWDSGGPTSILLMIITTQNYKYFEGRDDLALEHVVNALPRALSSAVFEPKIKGHQEEDFNSKFDAATKAKHCEAAKKFNQNIISALNVPVKDFAISQLKTGFGHRIPSDANLIEHDNGILTSDILKAFSTEPKKFVTPAVIEPTHGG